MSYGAIFAVHSFKEFIMNDFAKVFTKWVAGIAIVAFVLVLLIKGHINHFNLEDWVSDLGTAVSLVGILAFLFEKVAWRCFSCVIGVPFIGGKWHGTLEYEDQTTHEWKSKDVSLKISQTLLSTHFLLNTDESQSESISCAYNPEKLNLTKEFVYTYRNIPDIQHRDESPIHYGTCILALHEDGGLSGEYWTARHTRGKMTLTRYKDGK